MEPNCFCENLTYTEAASTERSKCCVRLPRDHTYVRQRVHWYWSTHATGTPNTGAQQTCVSGPHTISSAEVCNKKADVMFQTKRTKPLLRLSDPSAMLTPSRLLLLLFSALCIFPVLFAPKTCVAHARAQPPYRIPQGNAGSAGSKPVADAPKPDRQPQVPVFSIDDSEDTPQRVPQRIERASVRAKWPRVVKIGLLLPRFDDIKEPFKRPLYSIEYNMPVIESAIDRVKHKLHLVPADVHLNITTPKERLLTNIDSPLEAFEMVFEGNAHVLFGPYQALETAQIARYTQVWNLPQVTTGALWAGFDRGFILMTRTQGTFTDFSKFFIYKVLKEFNYTHVGIIYEKEKLSDPSFVQIVKPIYMRLAREGQGMPYSEVESNFNESDFLDILLKRQKDSRRGISGTADSETSLRSAETFLPGIRARRWRRGLTEGLKACDHLVVDKDLSLRTRK
ncbi:guanylate cyclase [Plakobranchus ocellatus]|uniref:Guanylate cyclase n=1 Tax=Plakobranchus ocellatus TaxID=259542 RepID=A0AAV4C541_9GAST|nr:guanylate cyclase [Plakobranchus ocellatus]